MSFGLTSNQAKTLRHIARCTCCGAWEVISDAELKMRAAGLMPPMNTCTHLDPDLDTEATA